jgi:hypothetical protein
MSPWLNADGRGARRCHQLSPSHEFLSLNRLRVASDNGEAWIFDFHQSERITDPATGKRILFEEADNELCRDF